MKNLVNDPILEQGHRRRLQKAVGERVYQLTKDENAQPALFRALYSAVKEQYGVSTYHDIKQIDFQDVLKFIDQWNKKRACEP